MEAAGRRFSVHGSMSLVDKPLVQKSERWISALSPASLSIRGATSKAALSFLRASSLFLLPGALFVIHEHGYVVSCKSPHCISDNQLHDVTTKSIRRELGLRKTCT